MNLRIGAGNFPRHATMLPAYSVLPRLPSRPLCHACFRTFATAVACPDAGRVPMDLTSVDCLFPELLLPGTSALLVGVDPDVRGALAALRWRNTADLRGATALQLAAAAEVEIHDMPVEVWKLRLRDKRQPAAEGLDGLLRALVATPAKGGGEVLVRAAVEYSTPQHLSGKHAWYSIGFSTGLLSGLMVSLGVPFQRVASSEWKRGMGLYRQGKEGSRALAAQLFPSAAEQHLRRKKDHGRAEAMLIAAWALGIRASVPDTAVEVSEEGEESDEAEAAGADSSGGDEAW